MTSPFLSSDSLEEVIGLDVGYTGGVSRGKAHDDEVEGKMDNYIAEWVKQREEKINFKRNTDNSSHGQSILGASLHSVNYVLEGSMRKGKQTSLSRAIDSMEQSRSSVNSRTDNVDLEKSNSDQSIGADRQ